MVPQPQKICQNMQETSNFLVRYERCKFSVFTFSCLMCLFAATSARYQSGVPVRSNSLQSPERVHHPHSDALTSPVGGGHHGHSNNLTNNAEAKEALDVVLAQVSLIHRRIIVHNCNLEFSNLKFQAERGKNGFKTLISFLRFSTRIRRYA